MKNCGEVIFNNVENEKILGPHALCVHAFGDTPIPSRLYDAYATRQVKYHHVLHNAVVMVTNSNKRPA